MAMKTGPALNWSTQSTAQQRIDQNNARITQLKAELQRLKGGAVSNMDMLDLELASNRANSYDMNGATTALSRIDSRMTNRAKELLDQQKANQLKDEQDYLKRSELEDKIRQLQIQRGQAKLQSDKDIIDSQLAHMGTQLEALGGEYVPMQYEGADTGEVLKDYYGNTANTKNGRKFLSGVDADKRTQMVQDLLAVGEYEKAAEIEKMMTPAEKEKARADFAKTKKKVKATIKQVLKDLSENENVTATDPEYMKKQAKLTKAEDMADSLARNYSSLVRLENGKPKYIAKD